MAAAMATNLSTHACYSFVPAKLRAVVWQVFTFENVFIQSRYTTELSIDAFADTL
jgi:hypothetical protein